MAKKHKKEKPIIPETLAESIPYKNVFDNGIIQLNEYQYSKSYILKDTNFKTADNYTQAKIASEYGEFLGQFDSGVQVEITMYNKTADMDDFKSNILMDMQADSFNHYRNEYNEMLLEKMTIAKNNIEIIKIMTITLTALDVIDATDKFVQIDNSVTEEMVHLTGGSAEPMTTIERLELLNSIYKQDSYSPLYQKREFNGRVIESFTLENCAKQGITTKDVIAPSSLVFNSKDFEIGNYVARTYYVSNFPTWISGTILTDFTSMPYNMLTSVHFNAMPQDQALRLLKRQGTNISASLVDNQKTASRSGYDASLVSPELQTASEETSDLVQTISRENSRLFTCTFVITLFATDKDSLRSAEEQLKIIANKNLITVMPLNLQQELGFDTTLPLGYNRIYTQRLMTTESVSAIIPFDVKEVRQKKGIFYGLNASSKNMIIYDRCSNLNPNGCILGMPGAGKSFEAKCEIISNLLARPDDEIYVIDPEREYTPLANAFGGSVVKIANGSNIHLNPFDLNINNKGDDGDPVKIKADFIDTIIDIAIGGKWGLDPRNKSIISRCVTALYTDYIENLNGKSIDIENAPTLKDFYEVLSCQPEPEAKNLCLSLERFVNGSLDIFAHHTNLNIENRFTIFDIKEIGTGLKELGLQICLDHIWNKMITNKEKKKRTWIYIDEFYILMQNPNSAAYVSQIWKRARKWDGVPTAITQNVEDMLKSEDARTILNNSSFVIMMGQSPINQKQLADLYNISPAEQKYISSAKPGLGLVRIGEDNIPMNSVFPKDTSLYKIMTTKPQDQLD